MNSIASIAMSGMQVAQQRLHASAHNIANLGTEGFAPQRVESLARADGGAAGVLRTDPVGSGDLVADAVEQVSASYAFRASAITLQRADSLLGTLLDARA